MFHVKPGGSLAGLFLGRGDRRFFLMSCPERVWVWEYVRSCLEEELF